MEQERKDFEEWIAEHYGITDFSRATDYDDSYNKQINREWVAWQAALESNNISVQPGWYIPLDCMSGIAEDTFAAMMKIIKHGGQVDVVARVDGKEYRWQCDGLKYAKLNKGN